MSYFPTSIPRCQHIKVNGTQCGSPALRRNRFCYFHKQWHGQRILINSRRARQARASIDMPVLEDANSVQVSVMQVMRLILSGRIDNKTAGLLLYALQTASFNLKHTRFEPLETRVIIDPRNVPDTPLGADPWSEEDYEDLADDDEGEDGDDTDEDEEEEDDDEQVSYQLVGKEPVAATPSNSSPPRSASPGVLSSSNTTPVTSCHRAMPQNRDKKSGRDCMMEQDYFKAHPPRTEADVDLTQLDDAERTEWRAMNPAAKAALIVLGYMPMKGEPPKQGRPWRNPDFKPPETQAPYATPPASSAPRPGTGQEATPKKMASTSESSTAGGNGNVSHKGSS
jgi:hypothetical protein